MSETTMADVTEPHGRRRCAFAATYLLIIGFGVGSWLAINGLWAELPILSQLTPEGPYLQSTINYTIQMANIGPLTYLFLDLVCLNVAKKKMNKDNFLILAICIVIFIGVVASVSLGVAYNKTTVIGGEKHSVALIALAFMLAIVDCTSTVTFIPYMERFDSVKFMTALFIGEGLSGIFPSMFALAQGVGIPHSNSNTTGNMTEDLYVTTNTSTTSVQLQVNFSPQVYFFLLTGLLVVCGLSFGMLQVLPQANHFKKTRNEPLKSPESQRKDSIESDDRPMEGNASAQFSDTDPLIFGATNQHPNLTLSQKCAGVLCFQGAHRQIHLFIMQAVISFLGNGAINTVSYFAFACYGPLTYLLAINLGLMVNPIASFVALFLPVLSHVGLIVVFVVSTLLGMLLLLFGFLGLTFYLPFLGSVGGSVLVILLSIATTAGISYTKVCLTTKIQKENQGEGENCALKWCGVSIQVGSLLGVLVFFPIVQASHNAAHFLDFCKHYQQW